VLALLLAVSEGDTHAAETETVNPILPTGEELVWGLITFFLLLALMKWVLLPPVLRVMREREARLRAERQAVAEAESGASDARAAYEARITEARTEAGAILAAAREEADQYRAQRFAEANADIAARRDEAVAEVTRAKADAMARMRGDVAVVAVTAAGRVMGKPLDLGRELEAIEAYVNAHGSGNGEGRSGEVR
jgi:F-type H+-transporting ATPase subunit b